METKLRRIAEKARNEPGFKFTSLYHLMNEELLRECFKRLRKDGSPMVGAGAYRTTGCLQPGAWGEVD